MKYLIKDKTTNTYFSTESFDIIGNNDLIARKFAADQFNSEKDAIKLLNTEEFISSDLKLRCEIKTISDEEAEELQNHLKKTREEQKIREEKINRQSKDWFDEMMNTKEPHEVILTYTNKDIPDFIIFYPESEGRDSLYDVIEDSYDEDIKEKLRNNKIRCYKYGNILITPNEAIDEPEKYKEPYKNKKEYNIESECELIEFD